MEKRLQLWSPVWGWLATKEGESVDLKGQDLVLYETAIQEALEQEKLYYRKKSAPFNLMDYYDADDSVKEKVQNLDIQVKKEQDGLYVCASLALIEPLTQQELEAIQNFLSRQYEGGIFDTSRIRTYSVEEGEVVFDFSVDTKEKFSQKEVQCETQKKYEITSIAHPQFPWLHRIRALVDVNEAVPKGTLGGFVEYEQNLSQEGSCWIYDQAICCERAVVERSAGLFQEAIHEHQIAESNVVQAVKQVGTEIEVYDLVPVGTEMTNLVPEKLVNCGYVDIMDEEFPDLDLCWNGKSTNILLVTEETYQALSQNLTPQTFSLQFHVDSEQENALKARFKEMIRKQNMKFQSEGGYPENLNLFQITCKSDLLRREQNYIQTSRLFLLFISGSLIFIGIMKF